MKKIKSIFIVSLIVLVGFSIFVPSAFAEGLVKCGTEWGCTNPSGVCETTTGSCSTSTGSSACLMNACTVCNFFEMIDGIIDYVSITIAPYLALLFIVVGAIMMMISGGSETLYNKGKDIITKTLIGLFIIWGSWLIIDVIMSATVIGTTGSASPWYTISCQ